MTLSSHIEMSKEFIQEDITTTDNQAVIENQPTIELPSDCDCITCSCDPCGAVENIPKEHSQPDSLTCGCCTCSELPSKECMDPLCTSRLEECNCEECHCPGKIPPSTLNVDLTIHPPNCTCFDCVLTHGVPNNDETPTKEKGIKEHPKDCDCVECLCDKGFPKKCKEPQDGLNDEIKQEINDLQTLLKQIQCACFEAEIQSEYCTVQPVFTGQNCSNQNVSDLMLALQSVRKKCKQKDHIIAAMVKELELRSESKVFSGLLQRIAKESSAKADFNRTEVCNLLPYPTWPCKHPDYPNCPCQSKTCSHPDYPNCPCNICAEKEEMGDTKQVLETGQNKLPADAAILEVPRHQAQSESKLSIKPVNKQEISQICKHPHFPHCACITKLLEGFPIGQAGQKQNETYPCFFKKHKETKKPYSGPCGIGYDKTQKCKEAVKIVSSEPNKPIGKDALVVCQPGVCHSCEENKSKPMVSSSPMEITDIRRISPDSLIIKWIPPQSKCVTGYEILVDGVLTSRIYSSSRTSAVLDALVLQDELIITLYAMVKGHRCKPPAKAVFQV